MSLRALILATIVALIPTGVRPQERLSDDELDGQRGGFLTAGGLIFDFGAVARTYADGRLALETTVNWTPEGAVVLQEGAGVSGGAEFTHQLAGSDFLNLIVNTDSNRTLRQEIDVTLTLPGFSAVQGDFTRSLMSLRLGDDIAAASIRATSAP